MKARMRRLSVSVDSAIIDQPEEARKQVPECSESSFQERVRKLLSSPLSRRKSASSGATTTSREGSKIKVFGSPLSLLALVDHPPTCQAVSLSPKHPGIPYVMTRLCDFIEKESGLNQEGLFRISANVRLVERLKHSFDESGDAPLEESGDVAAAAALLKQFLRELPQPVIPSHLNQPFFSAIRSTGVECKERLKPLVAVLPNENFIVLKYLCSFLRRVSLNEESNRMNSSSLGIVFGPNIFRVSPEDYKEYKDQAISGPNQIMSLMISECDYIFEEDMHRTSCFLRASSLAADPHSSKRKDKVKRRGASEGEESLCHRLNSHIIPILILNSETLSAAMPTKKTLLSDRKRRNSKFLGPESPLLCRSSSEERPPSTHNSLTPSPTEIRRSLSTDEFREISSTPLSQSTPMREKDANMENTCSLSYPSGTPPAGDGVSVKERETHKQDSQGLLAVASTGRVHRNSWPRSEKDSDEKLMNSSYADLASDHPLLVSSITRHLSSSEASVSPSACRSYLNQRSKRLSDPNVAPSPPQDQEFLISTNQSLAAASIRATIVKDARKKIQVLKQQLQDFEHEFELKSGRKASVEEKMESPVARPLLQQILRLQRSLRDFKHMSSQDLDATLSDKSESRGPEMLLKTLSLVQKELEVKRTTTGRPSALELMTRDQIMQEKIDLQKALLRFEAVHGRPTCKQDRDVVRPLYDRYRSVKRMVIRAPSSLEADHSASELPPIMEHDILTITTHPPVARDVKRNDKFKMAGSSVPRESDLQDEMQERSLHELPAAQLSELLHEIRLEKRRLRRSIKQFEDAFLKEMGRKAERGDRGEVAQVYGRYKNAKGRIRLLEALITKTDKKASGMRCPGRSYCRHQDNDSVSDECF